MGHNCRRQFPAKVKSKPGKKTIKSFVWYLHEKWRSRSQSKVTFKVKKYPKRQWHLGNSRKNYWRGNFKILRNKQWRFFRKLKSIQLNFKPIQEVDTNNFGPFCVDMLILYCSVFLLSVLYIHCNTKSYQWLLFEVTFRSPRTVRMWCELDCSISEVNEISL